MSQLTLIFIKTNTAQRTTNTSCARERVRAAGCLIDDVMRREVHKHFPDFYTFFLEA